MPSYDRLPTSLRGLVEKQTAHPFFGGSPSRRSVVHSANGIVSCTQPLAAQAGLQILRAGGNAADAAVAVAAALNVTEPASTGIGGDMFCLYYSAETKSVRGINASGRSPARLTLERARKDLGLKGTGEDLDELIQEKLPMSHAHGVTVPGTAAGWVDVVEKFGSGKVDMNQVLGEAIRLAEEGFPVSEVAADAWAGGAEHLITSSTNWRDMLKNGVRAPREGEIMTMKLLARVFKKLANEGKKGFYEGEIAEAIVEAVKERGGVLALDDLKNHLETGSEVTEPISLEFDGERVWECAPNGQGIVALMALGILEALEKSGKIKPLGGTEKGWGHNEVEYLHAVIEALRIAFADGAWWVADPDQKPPVASLIDKSYLSDRSNLFSPDKAHPRLLHGSPALQSCDTVYFSVTDSAGNGCSFINSTYANFGSGIVPKDCGFQLHNRGTGFSLRKGHINALAPRKRPYHTIIPAILTDPTGTELRAVFGVMGGYMQPQGHVQVLLNMLRSGMNPQLALDAPRICVGASYTPGSVAVNVEDGISEEVVEGLRKKGHDVTVLKGKQRSLFGRGQIVLCSHDQDEGGRKVWSAGSDPRGDGHAIGY